MCAWACSCACACECAATSRRRCEYNHTLPRKSNITLVVDVMRRFPHCGGLERQKIDHRNLNTRHKTCEMKPKPEPLRPSELPQYRLRTKSASLRLVSFCVQKHCPRTRSATLQPIVPRQNLFSIITRRLASWRPPSFYSAPDSLRRHGGHA